MSSPADVDVQVADGLADIPDTTFLDDWVCRAVAAAGVESAVSVSLRIVDWDESRSLNREFRDRDRPTNVLSFPAGDIDGLPAEVERPLGDLVLCAPVIAAEAEAQGKAAADHWAHMLVHGTLHLLGYDHVSDDEAGDMEALETRILAAGGIRDPYNAGA